LTVEGRAADDVAVESVRVRIVRDADDGSNRDWQTWDGSAWVGGAAVWHVVPVVGGAWAWSTSVVVDGVGESGAWVQAIAMDSSGNEDPSRASTPITLVQDAGGVDTSAPDTTIESPVAGSFVVGDPRLAISGRGIDDVALESVRVRLVRDAQAGPGRMWETWDGDAWVGGAAVWHPAVVVGSSWAFSPQVDVPVGGEPGIWVQAIAMDTSGNEDPSRASTFVNLVEDVGGDTVAPDTFIDVPLVGAVVGGPLTVEGRAADDVAVESVRVRIVRDADDGPNRDWETWDGSAWVGGAAVWHVVPVVGGDWEWSTSVVVDGVGEPGAWVQAIAMDTSGNEDPSRASNPILLQLT